MCFEFDPQYLNESELNFEFWYVWEYSSVEKVPKCDACRSYRHSVFYFNSPKRKLAVWKQDRVDRKFSYRIKFGTYKVLNGFRMQQSWRSQTEHVAQTAIRIVKKCNPNKKDTMNIFNFLYPWLLKNSQQ